MANRLGDFMENEGTKFVRGCVPTAIEKIEDPKEGEPGLYKVWGKQDGNEYCEEFNTSKWAHSRTERQTELRIDGYSVIDSWLRSKPANVLFCSAPYYPNQWPSFPLPSPLQFCSPSDVMLARTKLVSMQSTLRRIPRT